MTAGPPASSISEVADDDTVVVDKDSLRTRLHWIIASLPQANPSRATLKRLNEFFMSATHVKK